MVQGSVYWRPEQNVTYKRKRSKMRSIHSTHLSTERTHLKSRSWWPKKDTYHETIFGCVQCVLVSLLGIWLVLNWEYLETRCFLEVLCYTLLEYMCFHWHSCCWRWKRELRHTYIRMKIKQLMIVLYRYLFCMLVSSLLTKIFCQKIHFHCEE